MERFSIRGYTSNMRSTDVLKCWPFDETKTEFVEAFLPPITVQKFKWWADGLDNKEVEAAANGVGCPVCLVFTAGTATGVNTHVDGCLAQSSRKEQIRMKSKSRVPKKRSIVEIFAVAPQVEKLYDDEDEVEDEDGGDFLCTEDDDVKLSALIHVGSNDRRKKKMKLEDQTLAIVNKLKKLKGVKKNKNGKEEERDIAPIDLSIPNKEKPLKLKKKYPLGSTGNCNGSSDTMELAKELVDVIPVQKRKPRAKCYVEGKNKTSGNSKLALEKQKSVLSVRGILKNNSKVVLRKKSRTCTLLESSKENWCGINQSDRRVRFSETDHSAERGKIFVSMDVYGSDRSSSISKENATELQSITEKQSSDMCLCVGKPNFVRPHASQEHLRNKPVALNQVAYCSENLHWLEHGYKIALPETASACSPGFLSTEKEAFMPNVITQGGDNMSISSGSNVKVISNVHYGDAHPSLAAICSRDFVNTFPQPSSHFLKDNGNGYGGLLFPSETTSENYNGQTLQHHPFHHLSPKELMRSICSLPDIDQRGVMRLERPMNEDFVGLPLNSQGEFIQLNSSGKVGFNQLMRPSTVSDSSRTLALCSELPSNTGDHLSFNNCQERAPSEKQFQFFPVLDRAKENPNFIVASRLGITGPQGIGRGDVPFIDYLRESSQSVYPLESGLDLMKIPSNKNKQDDQIWNHSSDRNMRQERNPDLMSLNVTQPTMRLMGQNFSVGNNYRNLHEDEMVWMDKQMIAKHRPADTTINNSLRRHFQSDLVMQPASGKGKKIACSAEIQINLASQSFLQIKPPDSRFSQPSLSCQTDAVYENPCRTFSGDPVGRSYPYFPPDASPAFFNKESNFQEPFACEYEPLPVNSRPIQASSPHIAFQNLSLNYTQSNKKHPQHYSTNSAFKFPFLRPDLGEHVRPSSCQNSFKNLPPWLLNATQVKETMIGSFQSYSVAGGSCDPCTMSGDNFQKIPSVCCRPEASYICNPLSIQSPLQNAKAPDLAPITQSPLIPVRHRFLPTLTMNNRREYRMKFKERMKARLSSAHGNRTKKRPAAKSDYSANPSKLCNMEISEDLSRSVIALEAIGNAGADVIGRREIFGLDLAKDVSKSMACGQNISQMDASKASTEIYPFFKLDGIAIPGPVKLTAGAKHILKPCQSMSLESNSRLTRSKVPFAAVTSSGTVLESQMKSAKIYRF